MRIQKKVPEFDRIVNDIISKLNDEDKAFIKSAKSDDLLMLHNSFGRWIRNTYRLWVDSELTLNWLNNPESHDIRNGIDFSEDHPDAVSSKIIKAVHEKLRS